MSETFLEWDEKSPNGGEHTTDYVPIIPRKAFNQSLAFLYGICSVKVRSKVSSAKFYCPGT